MRACSESQEIARIRNATSGDKRFAESVASKVLGHTSSFGKGLIATRALYNAVLGHRETTRPIQNQSKM